MRKKKIPKKAIDMDVFYRLERMFEPLQNFSWYEVDEVVNGKSGYKGIAEAVRELQLSGKSHREILLLLGEAHERAMSFFEVWRRLWPIWEDGSFPGMHGLKEEKNE